MNRKERRRISKIANKKLEVIEAKKKRFGVDSEEIRVFKTYLWGYLYYIKKGWKIAPITLIGFMALAFRYDGLSLSVIWKGMGVACLGYRTRQNMRLRLKLGAFKLYTI